MSQSDNLSRCDYEAAGDLFYAYSHKSIYTHELETKGKVSMLTGLV